MTAGPVIGGTYISPQSVADGQPFAAFGDVTLTDSGSSGPVTATIIMTADGAATDANGTLTGTGLSRTSTGTYTLTAASPADLQTALRGVVFTPTLLAGAGASSLSTGLTLQISDGIAPAATDTNTVIQTFLDAQILSLLVTPVPDQPNSYTSISRTGETLYSTAPVTHTGSVAATTITAELNGQTVFQQSFDLPFSDPAVQAAVTQADQLLTADGAVPGQPVLASTQVTQGTPQTVTVQTGQSVSTAISITINFGPAQLFGVLDLNGTPNSAFTLLAGQEDTNTNTDYQTTIDQTATTTTTQLTTRQYTISATTNDPVIRGTYTAPQGVTDGQPFAAFGSVTLTDSGSNGPETATITMTASGVATDNNGTLTGGALSKAGTGTYTLTTASPADLQAALRALLFTPADLSAGLEQSSLSTGLTLQVSDGTTSATDTNTVIDALLGSDPLSLTASPVPSQPNLFTSVSRTGETIYSTTPITLTGSAATTTITAMLNGQPMFQQSFDLPYSDPVVQAAVVQADQLLAADGATASLPALTSSQVTEGSPQTVTVQTGQSVGAVGSVTMNFGPGQVFGVLDLNGTPNSTFTLLAGQKDTNVNTAYQTTIDQTATTTTTQLTAQQYTISGEVECFVAGTGILTPHGRIAVEALSVGDRVCTISGSDAAIKWIGRRHIDCRRHPKPEQIWPFRISAEAFGPGRPYRDLLLSPDHSIHAEGVLIPIKYLENGMTVIQARVTQVDYYHLDLDRHDVIYAEALPCESYLDTGNRNAFANGGTLAQIHPHFVPPSGHQTIWEATGYAPLHIAGEIVDRVAAQLRARATLPLSRMRERSPYAARG